MKNSFNTLLLLAVVVLQGCRKEFAVNPTYSVGLFHYQKGGEKVWNSIPITYYGYTTQNGKFDFGTKLGECECCDEAFRAILASNSRVNAIKGSFAFKVEELKVKSCK